MIRKTALIVFLIGIISLLGCQTQQLASANFGTWTLVLPAEGDGNEYLIITDLDTGSIVDPNTTNNSTGIPELSTTWDEGTIAVAAHAESAWLTFSIPALDDGYRYAGAVYSNGTPANTDAPVNSWTFLIDPLRQVIYSDANPSWKGKVSTWK